MASARRTQGRAGTEDAASRGGEPAATSGGGEEDGAGGVDGPALTGAGGVDGPASTEAGCGSGPASTEAGRGVAAARSGGGMRGAADGEGSATNLEGGVGGGPEDAPDGPDYPPSSAGFLSPFLAYGPPDIRAGVTPIAASIDFPAAPEASAGEGPGEVPPGTPPTALVDTYMNREGQHVTRERRGEVHCCYCWNDGSAEAGQVLLGLKAVFSRCLPNMPRSYIARLLFDPRHRSVVAVSGPAPERGEGTGTGGPAASGGGGDAEPPSRATGRVLGGITYRPFMAQGFAEIAFCAVAQSVQVSGFGTRLMNVAKDAARDRDRVGYFLTYADNAAVGYFQKQGFSRQITLERDRWSGWIKDYDGGTLMECSFGSRVPHGSLPPLVAWQKAALEARIRTRTRAHVLRKGLPFWDDDDGDGGGGGDRGGAGAVDGRAGTSGAGGVGEHAAAGGAAAADGGGGGGSGSSGAGAEDAALASLAAWRRQPLPLALGPPRPRKYRAIAFEDIPGVVEARVERAAWDAGRRTYSIVPVKGEGGVGSGGAGKPAAAGRAGGAASHASPAPGAGGGGAGAGTGTSGGAPSPARLAPLLRSLVTRLQREPDAWPFLAPVLAEEVPDYYEVVRTPVDLSTIQARLDSGAYYTSLELFVAEVDRMFANAQLYNASDTFFHKAAGRLQNTFHGWVAERVVWED